MDTADQVIAVLRRATGYPDDPPVRTAFEALMGQLAAQLVGEPLADGEVTEAEWVLLNSSLRALSRSPRSVGAWARIRHEADGLDRLMAEAELAKAVAPPPAVEPSSTVTPRRSSLRPAWLSALSRSRAAQQVTTTIQHVDTIQNSQNVNLITTITPGGVLDVDDGQEEDTAPAEPEQSPASCDIFLSYSRRDARLMRRVRADLRAEGFDVWTDESLKPGTPSWLDAVETAIRSSMCVIVLLTPDARKSEWVGKELSTAKIHRKQIIPLLARGDEKASVPMLLSNTQYADIRSEANYKRKMVDLARVLQNLKRGAKVRA